MLVSPEGHGRGLHHLRDEVGLGPDDLQSCKVLMDGYGVFRRWMLAHTELYVDNIITIQYMASSFIVLLSMNEIVSYA